MLLAGALQISLAACCFYFIGAQAAKKLILNENAPLDYVWAGWLIMNDPGAMNLAEGSVGRVVAAMFGLTGIIYFSMVLGFVIDALMVLVGCISGFAVAAYLPPNSLYFRFCCRGLLA